MPPRTLVALLCVLLVVTAGTPALAGPGETVSIENSLDIPDRTATYDGTDYTIAAVRLADPGDVVDVSATVVEDDPYRVHVRSSDDALVDSSNRQSDNTTVSFDLSGYDAGTYLVALNQDGSYRAIQPLVVRAFSVSADVPTSAEANAELSVSADVTRLRGSNSPTVEAIVGNDSHTVRVNATERNGGYEASVPLDELSPGTYSAYVVVTGPDRAFGEPELLGASERTNLEVRASDTGDGGTGGGGSGGSGSGGGGSVGGTGGGGSGDGGTGGTSAGTPTETTPTTVGPSTPTPTTTPTDGVITPRPTTEPAGPTGTTAAPATGTKPATPGGESGASQPGFGPFAAFAALFALAALLARRRA
jgi:uncharacterized protein (TIGR03382 family)